MMTIDISSLVDMSRGLVDRRIFADQAIYDLEMERIFRRNWICLGHETEIPNKNDYFTTWIGEDPVIVVRGGDGKIRVLLNLCRHRGGTVCRVDKGNARSFLCPYHGWAYANDGSLKGVPSLEVGYRNQLDLEEWGLVEVPRVDSYKGLLFATWDRHGPDLVTFLADSTFYLDCLLDRLDGGTEIVVGTRRWVVPCNWKHAAENFIGDSYHAAFTHASIFKVPGLEGAGNRVSGTEGYQIQCGNGHGVGAWVASKEAARGGYGHLEGVDDWMATPEIENEMRARLGDFRATQLTPVHATIFPNFSIEFPFASLHIWHPKGPLKTEVRDLTIVDKKAPQHIKDLLRNHCTLRQGPAGTWEQDDMDNWAQTSFSARNPISRMLPANYQMGMGYEFRQERMPGLLDNKHSDINQRAMYQTWADQMAQPIDIDPEITGRRHVMDEHGQHKRIV